MREGALRKNATRAVMYIFLIAVSLISVFPLYWSFISAFNNTQQILGGWLLPSTHLLENLQHLFEQHNVVRALKNSFATTLLQTFAALAVSSIAGYGFEIYHDKAKDTVMAILMLAMMVPFVPDVHQGEAHQLVDGLHPAEHRNAVSDYVFQKQRAQLPAGYARGGAHRRPE